MKSLIFRWEKDTAMSILLPWLVNAVHLIIQAAGSKLPVNYQLCQQVEHNKDLIAFAFGILLPQGMATVISIVRQSSYLVVFHLEKDQECKC